jgi:LCP family protein required for cell wall assembly
MGAVLAALLSAVVPGLGQLYAGARRRAAFVAIPFALLVVVATAAGAAVAGGGLRVEDLLGAALRPEVLAGALVADLALLGYRVFAMIDAWLVARRRGGAGSGSPLVTAVSVTLLVAIIGVNAVGHVGAAAIGWEIASTGQSILAGDDPGDALLSPDDPTGLLDDEPSPSPIQTAKPGLPGSNQAGGAEFGRAQAPQPSPPPTWARDDRLDVLLLGVDSGPGRWSLRTDTMILMSVDYRTGAAALFGIPRNIVNVPLPKESAKAFPGCRCYPRMLNSLYVYAMGHPGSFPGGDNRGLRAVAGAIESLVGVDIDGMAIIDLNGFVKLVDALGGLRITVPQAIYDQRYPKPDGSGYRTIYIKAGKQKMSGATALAYARSRHQSSDYSRMRRQQEVLVALRKQVQPCTVLADLPKLLKAVKGTLKTTFKTDALPDLLRLAARVKADDTMRFSIAPPNYPEYLSKSDWKRIRTLVRRVFDKPRAKAEKEAAEASASPSSIFADDPCKPD